MKTIEKLGELALASRLRRLSDVFMQDTERIYRNLNLEFEPKWFPVFYALSEKGPLSIMAISEELEVSHPGVIQIIKELEKSGLVFSEKDASDNRKRMVALSEKGLEILPRLQLVWKAIIDTNLKTLQSQTHDLLYAIEEMEELLKEKNQYQRIMETIKNQQLNEVQIIDYQSIHRESFKNLNVAWIEKYFKIEPSDLAQLENPEGYILEKGGWVLLAQIGDEIVGTAALIKSSDTFFELAKMAVDEKHQGKQIGKKLAIVAIEKAREMGAKQLFLESNRKLTPALNLYKSVGFREVKLRDSPYERADIQMLIDL
jgi:DNA-binding MarR family transcriptional regulator/predicted GNAT family N-acyltransferase